MERELNAFLMERMPNLEDARFLIALSGGADSVAILKLMAKLAQEHGFLMAAAHVNHGLRGKKSDEDEAFCKMLATDIGVPLFCHRVEIKKGAGLEARAREARYACLKRSYEEWGADALLTAHHAADQAETMLMHLMRGAGIRGLSGIAADTTLFGMRVLRPLLMTNKRDLIAIAGEFCRDESNDVADNLRNALRLKVMPMLEEMAPGATEKMAQAAQIAALEDGFMDGLCGEVITNEVFLPIRALQTLHLAVLLRVLRRFAGGCDYGTTLALKALLFAEPGGKVNLDGGLTVYRGHDYLFLPHLLLPVAPVFEVQPFCGKTGDGKRCQAMPRAVFEKADWRYWLGGDVIRPFGFTGRQSLQDYFTNRKVDAPFRRVIPILATGNRVIWIPGVGAAEETKMSFDGENIMVECGHDMPWLIERKNER